MLKPKYLKLLYCVKYVSTVNMMLLNLALRQATLAILVSVLQYIVKKTFEYYVNGAVMYLLVSLILRKHLTV